ncbi:MAG: CehA/McbA family metallohydrolase [Polyangiaceae bacterium]
MTATTRRLALTPILGVTLLLACGPEPSPAPGEPAPKPAAAPPIHGAAKISRLTRPPTLHGHRVATTPGRDWQLEGDESLVVVDGASGRVVAFGPRRDDGAIDNALVDLEASVFFGFDAAPHAPPIIEAEDGALHLTFRILTAPLLHHLWLALDGKVLTLASRVDDAGDDRVLGLSLGERPAFSNTPTWLEGHGELLEGGSRGGAFVGRDGPGVGYAMCNHDGRMNVKITTPSAPGFHRTGSAFRDRIGLAPGESSPLRRVALAHGTSLGDALLALPCAFEHDVVDVPGSMRDDVEVFHCESAEAHAARLLRDEVDAEEGEAKVAAAAPYARFLRASRIALPQPCARARLARFGHAPGTFFDPRRDDEAGWGHPEIAPKAGRLAWRIREGDAVVPAKLVVRGRGETKAPDWGEDPVRGAAKSFVYTTGDGEIPIPPGRYTVSAFRGLEYGRVERDLEIRAGEATSFDAKLVREVDTAGWLSADLHVHAMPSWDAPASLEDRVRSLAAVGVEVAVATDHNAVTDYGPAIRRLGLDAHLASVVGDEVTTEHPDLGHFNVFPLVPPSPLPHAEMDPHELFAAARRRSPNGVLQVNHPRMGSIGYFELLHLDRGAPRPWSLRSPFTEVGFDAIEVFNGDHFDHIGEVEWVLEDWFALMDAGMRYTATGNSDSHKVSYQDAGMPRNWVAVEDDDPRTFDEERFIAAIRAGKVVVSSGPFLTLTANGAGIGETVVLHGEATVEVMVRVDAPGWIDVDTVELLRRGHVVKRWKVPAGKRHPRLEAALQLPVGPGDWLVAIARGDGRLPNLYRSQGRPFAFTNPIHLR